MNVREELTKLIKELNIETAEHHYWVKLVVVVAILVFVFFSKVNY